MTPDRALQLTGLLVFALGSNLPLGSKIRQISVRPDDRLASAAYTFNTYRMTMSNTKVNAAGLSRTLANNHGATKTVVANLTAKNCQASSAALFVSLSEEGLIDQSMKSPDDYMETISARDASKAPNQGSAVFYPALK